MIQNQANNKKKEQCIVIVTPGFPINEEDTTCLPFIQQFVLALINQFPNQHFIILSLHYPFYHKQYQWHGVTIQAIGGKNKGHFFGLYTRYKINEYLNYFHKTYHVKGVLSFWCIDSALAANTFAKKNNVKHFIWIVGQDAKITNGYVKRINPRPEQLIAMSSFLKKEFFINHCILPKHIINNGINDASFEPLNKGNRAITIFGAGNLTALKNYDLFIEVIAEVVKTNPSIVVKIAGKGEQFQVLQNVINNHQLTKNIELLGEKKHSEVLTLMNQSQVFLHTSNYEGNSTVLMEALYSGCLVVSTQALSNEVVENLQIGSSKKDLINLLLSALNKPKSCERIVFNTMNDSVKKIMNLFN